MTQNNDYYQKYVKYKAKYIEFKNNYIIDNSEHINNHVLLKGGAKYDFFFIHATKNFSNLISILNQGYIYPGKSVKKKHRFMSGSDAESEHIYMSLYFKDIDNIEHVYGISLMLDPKIIYDRDIIFHEGWYGGNPLYLYKNDTRNNINKKITKIHDFLKNPISLPKILRVGLMNHQVLTSEPISLKDYLIGIAINIHDDGSYKKELDRVKKILKQEGYNVPIYYVREYKNINI